VPLDVDSLKSERERLKVALRELEGEQRKLEAELKLHRQHEVQTKREIEALGVLIDLAESRASDEPAK
jgi:predicted  nucleic acid-binding Zn-ribbon protein